jgi:1,4-dihydroxy-6-naphthoate synthase
LLEDAPLVTTVLDDVEVLNQAALQGRYALTKSSYGALPGLLGRYRVLRAGGALGRGCGPLVVARPDFAENHATLKSFPRAATIAIPGRLTTAYLLLRLALGFEPRVTVLRFDAVVEAVARGEADAGLIIHESRFRYSRSGLRQLADLGEWWESQTGHPIPLGAILVRRDVANPSPRTLDATIRASLSFAREHGGVVAPYVREHAFEMDDAVMRAHIDLYVNGYSDDVGEDGMAAVHELFLRAARAGLVAPGVEPEFV